MDTYEPLNKRLGRFAVMMGTVFFITAAVVVSQRLSEDSLALLIGLSCGVAAMLPTLGLGFFVWRREVNRQSSVQNAPTASPPVIVVTPQALPGYGQYGAQNPALVQASNPQNWQWQSEPAKRNFTIVGGEE